MKFSVLEIFSIFWLSAFVWVLIEYIHQRLSKRDREHRSMQTYEKDRKEDTFAA